MIFEQQPGLVVMRAAWHYIGFAPGVPHLANLPLAALQRVVFAGAVVAHLMNFPLASRHGAASAGVDSSAIEAAASIMLRIMVFLPPLSRRTGNYA